MPMLLKSTDGKEFELAIIADRLPEAQDGFGDDETPTVSFRVATEDIQFEETAPNLGAHELHALVEWLESVASLETPGEAEIDLLEPELNFQVLRDQGENVALRVRFHLDGVPDEMTLSADTPEARHIDLKLPRELIRAAAAQLRADLEDFTTTPAAYKDDILGDEDLGNIPAPDPDLGLIDGISDEPPGAGMGEDNAGNR